MTMVDFETEGTIDADGEHMILETFRREGLGVHDFGAMLSKACGVALWVCFGYKKRDLAIKAMIIAFGGILYLMWFLG